MGESGPSVVALGRCVLGGSSAALGEAALLGRAQVWIGPSGAEEGKGRTRGSGVLQASTAVCWFVAQARGGKLLE